MLVAGTVTHATSSLAVSAAERCAAVSVLGRNELIISIELPPEDAAKREWSLWIDDYSNQVGRGRLGKTARIETVKYDGAVVGKHYIGLVVLGMNGEMRDVCWVAADVKESTRWSLLEKGILGPATGAFITLVTIFYTNRWSDRRTAKECVSRLRVDSQNAIANVGESEKDSSNLIFISRNEDEWVRRTCQDTKYADIVNEFRKIWREWRTSGWMVDGKDRAMNQLMDLKKRLDIVAERRERSCWDRGWRRWKNCLSKAGGAGRRQAEGG